MISTASGGTRTRFSGVHFLALALFVVVSVSCCADSGATDARDEIVPQAVDQFVRSNCLDCHDGPDADGGLDLATLGRDLQDENLFAKWERVFDRVHQGEMPPEDYGEVDADQLQGFLQSAGDWLHESQQHDRESFGRVRGRRLTNVQLERTLQDLLGIDVPLRDLLTDEPRTGGFVGIADGQSMSHFQLENHLSVVDAALDAAFDRVAAGETKPLRREYSARQLARRNPQARCRDPEMRDGLAVVWTGSLIFYGRVTSTTVARSGWYRINVKASSVKTPKDHGLWCSVRTGRCTSGAPLMHWVGSFEATDDPAEMTFETWIPAGHMIEIRPCDATIRGAKFQGGQVGTGEGEPQNVPGVALHSMVMEEIHPAGDVAVTKRKLFGELKIASSRDKDQLRLVSDDVTKDAAQQLRAFARRALRRSVTESQLQPYLSLLRRSISEGVQPLDALRSCYRAILCSPRFMYFTEPQGRLDDFAIASRLSYMLWDSMPDFVLRKLANEGKLQDDDVIHQQVERMLRHRRGQDFVQRFSSQWLDLVDIDFTEPDRKLYRDFDVVVQNSMMAETHNYLQDMLQRDRPAVELVASRTTYLNTRLARFYGIEDQVDDQLSGDQMRRVRLPSESHRGGLLAQGAVLKVTANGTNTSPVLRGVWVSERLLGQEIPPPPENVPAIEPDIRGAKTVREMLEKHKSDEACAGCHKKIDPPGFAIENFDAVGQWRDHYVVVKSGRGRSGPAVDPSFTLPDGREFKDFDQFRDLWRQTPRPIARCFAEKLVVYGTGAPIEFVDHQAVDRIVDSTKDAQYGLRSLLHAAVTSSIFLEK